MYLSVLASPGHYVTYAAKSGRDEIFHRPMTPYMPQAFSEYWVHLCGALRTDDEVGALPKEVREDREVAQ